MELALGSYRFPAVGLRRSSEGHRRKALGVAIIALLAATFYGRRRNGRHQQVSDSVFVSVIVRKMPGAGHAPERSVESFGGDVGRTLAIIDGFAARVPSELVDNLRRVRGVQSVT